MSQSAAQTGHFDLQRFIAAQDPGYPAVIDELRGGQKRSHWMWFVFPQVLGLGHSSMAERYAIRSREEALAYLSTPMLGARLIECTGLVLATPHKSALDIFGSPDDMKFRSSMTLFAEVDRGGTLYRQALDRFFDGKPDNATLATMKRWDR